MVGPEARSLGRGGGWAKVLQLVWMVLGVGLGTGAATAAAIEFADSALEQAVRRTLGKPAGELTPEDMDQVLDLGTNAVRRGITSLAGLESARYLTRLNLEGNRLTTVRIPATWEILVTLNLAGNELTELSWEKPPPLLQLLNVKGNQLERLELPEGLISLETVAVDSNRLTRLEMPVGLGQLKTVVASHNRLTEFVVPAPLQLAYLHLRGNPLATLRMEVEQMDLWRLDLGECPLSDTGFLDVVPRLRQLIMSGIPGGVSRLPDFWAQLRNLDGLEQLDLSGNELTQFELSRLSPALQGLNLRGNALKTLRLPAGLRVLNTLDLGGNPWNDLAFLAEVESEYVGVFLEGMTSEEVTLPPGAGKVVSLFLGGASVGSLEIPPGWAGLTFLDVSGSRITNLTLAADLGALRQLEARGSALRRLAIPGTLGALQEVRLDGTPLAELRLGRGLASLSRIGISDTPLRQLVIPPGLAWLVEISLDRVALETLWVSADAVENLGGLLWLADFKGIRVSEYPPRPRLRVPRRGNGGALVVDVESPPGRYRVMRSSDLAGWMVVGEVANEGLGFTWVEAGGDGAGVGAEFFRVEEAVSWFP